jgi:single-stranded-DNA-specific exonuclease
VRWILPSVIEEQADALCRALGVHPLVARVLAGRGLNSPELAAGFLKDRLTDLPDPSTMKGMPGAVERLLRAVRTGERITLYGDYDVDGVCSTALLSLFLEQIGAKVATYIPHRIDEGYGLNLTAIEKLAQEGAQVLVTLDCGITSVAEVARARALGLSVVVVDHHTVPAELPDATAILNPHQPGCEYPTKHLCAAGVAFNLCMALRRALREAGHFGSREEPNLKSLLDLVALATIADVVPLTGANRILVKHGLAELTDAARPGVRALKEVAGLLPAGTVSTGQVGFKLAPRINAAGRLDDASVGLCLLRARTLEQARPLAQALDAANGERQLLEKEMVVQALELAQIRADRRALVLAKEGWHPGVIGIVASRVVDRFHRPTLVIALKDGTGKGSGRSIEGFHLFDAISACGDQLVRFGGHKHAAGITVEASRLGTFAERFEAIAKEKLSEEDLVPRCRVDAVVPLGQLDAALVDSLAVLAPFGSGNPEPLFASRRVLARGRVLNDKSGEGRHHLKLALDGAPKLDAIGFGLGDRLALTEGPLDLAYQVSLDEWRGEQRLSLKLKDLRAA